MKPGRRNIFAPRDKSVGEASNKSAKSFLPSKSQKDRSVSSYSGISNDASPAREYGVEKQKKSKRINLDEINRTANVRNTV